MASLPPFATALSPSTIAGISLWAMALYLGFFQAGERLSEQLTGWLSRISQSSKAARATQSSEACLLASLASIVPFLVAGALLDWGVEWSLGHSWAVSMGLLACIGLGVYELGRRDGEAS